MSTNYPTSIQSLSGSRGTTGQPLSTPNHVTHHTTEDDTIEALQAKVGVNGSAVTTSHDYKLSEVTGSDKAVSKTATQTLTNKTLTSPQINLTGDATGDMYYRNSGGTFARLPIGSTGQIIQVSASGIPEYIANPSAADASTTVKGVVELATSAEIDAGTATGATGAKLTVTPDALASSKYANTLSFGGDGSDGALSISSGTTTIDCTNQAVVVKNYTSISITGTGKLAFSNPNTNGTIIILKSQGAVTLTSSSSSVIDLSNMGASGGAVGSTGTSGISNNLLASTGGANGTGAVNGSGGVISLSSQIIGNLNLRNYPAITIGAGGGGAQTGATGAVGGRGAGSLVLECNGAFNFTTGTIEARGTAGTNAGGGIGGAGGSGSVYVLYKTLTANSGTINVASTAGTAGGGSFFSGGGGAGASGGSAGASSNLSGAGGAGTSSVIKI